MFVRLGFFGARSTGRRGRTGAHPRSRPGIFACRVGDSREGTHREREPSHEYSLPGGDAHYERPREHCTRLEAQWHWSLGARSLARGVAARRGRAGANAGPRGNARAPRFYVSTAFQTRWAPTE